MSESQNDQSNSLKQVGETGTPAEDREEERAGRLWDLKEEAKWGKDASTQRKAIEDLRRNGTSALSYLEEILAVVPPGEIKQHCQNAIESIVSARPNEAKPIEKT